MYRRHRGTGHGTRRESGDRLCGADPGSFDILIEVVCEDDDHLLSILNRTVRKHPEVTGTETLVYLKLVKQQYNWGTR